MYVFSLAASCPKYITALFIHLMLQDCIPNQKHNVFFCCLFQTKCKATNGLMFHLETFTMFEFN